MSVLYVALVWVVGSAAAALYFGRRLKLQPLYAVDDEEGGPPWDAPGLDGGEERLPHGGAHQEGDLDLDDQPVSRVNTTSRAGSGKALRSSRSA